MSQENEAPKEPAGAKPDKNDRVSTMTALSESWAYVGKAMRDETIQIRDTDRLTSKLLKFSLLGACICVIVPFFHLRQLAIVFYGLADLLFLSSVLVFVVSRFGIFRVMTPRHALVCWHLMIGTSLLSIAIALNVIFIAVYAVAGRYVTSGG